MERQPNKFQQLKMPQRLETMPEPSTLSLILFATIGTGLIYLAISIGYYLTVMD